MLKKVLFSLFSGLVVFGFCHLISNHTHLLTGIERNLQRGFFFLREYDAGEENPLVSAEAKILGFDEDAIAAIGKWPWKRYVHGEFLRNVGTFSPRAVLFDIIFATRETVPSFVEKKLQAYPESSALVEQAFDDMDGYFSGALKEHDNVYLDLHLIEQPRPELPPSYQQRILYNEDRIKLYSQPVDGNESLLLFHSLQPIVKMFAEHSHPVAINVLPDDDGVTRFFPLYYTYQMSDGSRWNVFTAVLSLLQRYYRVGLGDIVLTRDHVVLRNAGVPVLDEDTKKPVVSIQDFQEIQGGVSNPAPAEGYPYNRNLFLSLVGRLRLGIQTEDKVPRFPVHLLKKADGGLEILDGWEAYDAALSAGSKKIQAVFYREEDVKIDTPLPGFVFINYAGREKVFTLDPATGRMGRHTPIPTSSYKEGYLMEKLPRVPEMDQSGDISEGWDTIPLEEWFLARCERKGRRIYEEALEFLGEDRATDEAIAAFMKQRPWDGKYFYYFIFFMNTGAMPGNLRSLAGQYEEFGKETGQAPEYFFDEKQMVLALIDAYMERFDRYLGRFIFAGATAVSLGDMQQTPYGAMSGISTIVSAFNTVVTQNQLTMSRHIPGFDVLILLLMSIGCVFVYRMTSIRINGFAFAAFFLGTLVVAFTLFIRENFLLRSVPLLLACSMGFLAITVYKVLTEQKNKRFLKSTFSSYLAPEIIDEMYQERIFPKLGGETRPITAFFSDIAGFTSFSETLPPERLVELLNEYLSHMTEILIEHGGTLDKYEGDAIIAFFGAPAFHPDHGIRACRVALAMQERLAELRLRWSAERADEAASGRSDAVSPEKWRPGDRWPSAVHNMRMRIGLNSGDAVVGNMGSTMRMNYTMMGDTVNLAARVEGLGKQYGVFLMATENTLNQRFPDEKGSLKTVRELMEVRFVDRVAVVGRLEAIGVYELIAEKGQLSQKERDLIRLFDEGMRSYQEMKWDEGIAAFTEARPLERFPDFGITPSDVFIERCRAFRENPPVPRGEVWDGVYRMEKK